MRLRQAGRCAGLFVYALVASAANPPAQDASVFERLCDAAAEREFEALGFRTAARQAVLDELYETRDI